MRQKKTAARVPTYRQHTLSYVHAVAVIAVVGGGGGGGGCMGSGMRQHTLNAGVDWMRRKGIMRLIPVLDHRADG